MMRTTLLVLAIAAAYLLLRGWPESWSVILRISLAGLILLAALLFWGRSSKSSSKGTTPTRKARFVDLLGPAMTILWVESFLLAFLALAPAPSGHLAASFHEMLVIESPSRLADEALPENPSLSNVAAETGQTITSNWLFSGPGPRRLNKDREVRPSNRPEIYLYPGSADDAQRLLTSHRFLRNFTLSSYRNGAWYPQAIVPNTLAAQNGRIDRLPATPGRPIDYEISHLASFGQPNLAVTIPSFTSLNQSTIREIAPDTFRLPPPPSGQKSYRYAVTSVPFDLSGVAEVVPGKSPSPEYLALPESPSFQKNLRDLAATFGPPSHSALNALHHHLQSQFEYTLNPSIPPDADPIENFLFESKKGYCSHFASATVMLARAMGIPSRMAFGWSGGRYFESPNFFVFRAREAHTWTEIFLRDYGWVIFETTPSSRNEGAPSIAPSGETPPYPDDDAPPVEASPDSDLPLATLLRISCSTGGLALVILLLGLAFKHRKQPESLTHSSHATLPEIPHYLATFRQACANQGCPMPPGRTLRDHLTRIGEPPFTRELLTYHYGVQYSENPRDRSRERRLLRQLREWSRSGSA